MDRDNKGDYIALREAARVYDYTRDHLGYLIRKGDLRGEKLGSFFFTTHEWMRDYLSKSGKSRKAHSTGTSPKTIVSRKGSGKVNSKRKTIFSINLTSFLPFIAQIGKATHKELKPLSNDITRLAKRSVNLVRKITKLRNSTKKRTYVGTELKKEMIAWKREGKYWAKRTKKKLLGSWSIALISSIGRIVSSTNTVPGILLERCFSLGKAMRNLAHSSTEKARVFINDTRETISWLSSDNIIDLSKKIGALISKVGRSILWLFPGGTIRLRAGARKASPKITHTKISGTCVAVVGLVILLVGANSLVLNFEQEIKSSLVASLDRASGSVYEFFGQADKAINTVREGQKQGIVFKEVRSVRVGADNNTQDITENLYKFVIKTEDSAQDALLKTKGLLIAAISRIDVKETAIKLSTARENLKKQTNNALIAMGDLGRDARINSMEIVSKATIALGKKRLELKSDINGWQDRNNVYLAKLESGIIDSGTTIAKNVNNKTGERLASLRDSLEFLIKPFREIGRFLAFGGGSGTSQTRELEERVSQLESEVETRSQIVKQNREGARPEQVYPELDRRIEGIVVIPSTENDEENKEKISSMFSDEIEVNPDRTGKSGIIKPVFKKKTDQEYLYMLVPIGE